MKLRLLRADEIDVKVKKVTAKGAIALLYKNVRTDMSILDETFGAENWTDDYREIKGNLFCGIGIKSTNSSDYVWKWDCGIESREDEGNEKKGEASDAFKRAGSKWGIGRELYSAPFIFINLETEQDGKSYKLKDKFAKFYVSEIEYEQRKIKSVVIKDRDGNVVFGKGASQPKAQPTTQPKTYSPPPQTNGVCNAASASQIAYLEKLGATVEQLANISKADASTLITQLSRRSSDA